MVADLEKNIRINIKLITRTHTQTTWNYWKQRCVGQNQYQTLNTLFINVT